MTNTPLITSPTLSSKDTYRVKNWSAYNNALIARGGFTLWLSEEVLDGWHDVSGRGAIYHTDAIIAALQIRAIYRLPLRQTQGFLKNLVKTLGLPLKTPHYSTLSRRGAGLDVPDLPKIPAGEQAHIVIDSTGLKVYGEGEWKVRTHKAAYRRTWRKLHLAIDEHTGLILSQEMTENDTHDGKVLETLLDKIDGKISQVSADKAYDSSEIHAIIVKRGANVTIPPRDKARLNSEGGKNHESRDKIIERIKETDKATWKRESGYHRRSLAETTMFRLKKTFGGAMRAKLIDQQKTEVKIKINILNHFIAAGKPESYKLISK
jgi:transposase